jgi:hypothetical protein
MPSATITPKKPSSKQLNFLRRLASEKGQTFTYPQTSGQASAEIRRLLGQTSSSHVERYLDRNAVSVMRAERPYDATQIYADEITGYGSTATWTRGDDF